MEEETTTATDTTQPGWLRPAIAAAAVLLVVGVGAVAFNGGDDSEAKGGGSLALTANAANASPSMQSCLMFDVNILKDMSVAFGGTATDVSGGEVTIDVDHWYKGGTAKTVTVSASAGAIVSIDETEFVEGKRYLVTATDGTVNGCGYSGEATADYQRSFDEAFGS